MPKTSALTIRIDPEVKKQSDSILKYLGMTTSEAISIFLRQVVLNNGLPFPVKVPIPNEETLTALKEAENILSSQNPRFDTAEEMFKSLGL